MKKKTPSMLQKIKDLCDGIEYSRDIPYEAKELARDNNIVVIVGGSDDLMYCYGARCYLTEHKEHGVWRGANLSKSPNDKLRFEACLLGLKVFWQGVIMDDDENVIERIEGYSVSSNGAFSYLVDDDIQHLNFKIFEEEPYKEVYCTGIIIKLPSYFLPLA